MVFDHHSTPCAEPPRPGPQGLELLLLVGGQGPALPLVRLQLPALHSDAPHSIKVRRLPRAPFHDTITKRREAFLPKNKRVSNPQGAKLLR